MDVRTGIIVSKKIVAVNMLSSFIATLLNILVGFFLAPYLTETVGGEAYGFVSLANNMVNYASIATVALNSVSGRFVSISIHKGEVKKANQYFSSVIGANTVLGVGTVAIFVPIVWNLEKLIKIPVGLVADVKLLYLFVVTNFVLTVVTNVFTVTTYITNQLYLSNLGNAICAVIRVAVLVVMFGLFPSNVAYVGLSAVVCTFFLAIYNIMLTQKLIPDLRLRKKDIYFSCIKELLSSGIWSSVTKLSQILTDGLDLLIVNIGVGALEMGQLSIAYTVPNMIATFFSIIVGVFGPRQTFFYAKEEKEKLLKDINYSMKITGLFGGILFAGVLTYGKEFFDLYVPSQDTELIYQLSCISILSVLISGAVTPLHNVALLTDHLKINSIAVFANSILVIILTVTLVVTTPLGVFAVAGVSRICGIAYSLIFVPVTSALWLDMSKRSFYPTILRYIVCTILLCAEFASLKIILPTATNVLSFIIDVCILGIVGILTNFLTLFNREEKKNVLNMTVGWLQKER